jgi:hypothetical protein
VLDRGVEAGVVGLGSKILIPPLVFPEDFLAFFLGTRINRGSPVTFPSLWITGTRSGGSVLEGLNARIVSQDRDGRNQDITFKPWDR